MDIAKLEASLNKSGIWYQARYVDGSKLDGEFFIIGRNTPEYKRIDAKYSRKFVSGRKDAIEDIVSDMTLDYLDTCVLDWKNISYDGEILPCTKENKRKIFSNPSLKWLSEQLEKAINDDSNFLLNQAL